MSLFRKVPNTGSTQNFKTKDWRTACEEVDPRPATEVTYEFSNGRKFLEAFRPTNGPYAS